MENYKISVSAKSSSNIAIVKYWGKHGNQLPNNPSISFTLSNCYTYTSVICDSKTTDGFKFFFEGKEAPKFKEKIVKFYEENKENFMFSPDVFNHLKIESYNSFPHSSGIASSASSMSALVLCLLKLENTFNHKETSVDLRRASQLSRLASGSASRSIYPVMALWGETPSLPESSDEYAVPLESIVNPIFKTYHDTILIVTNKEKAVSSSVGHKLMDNHPMAESRYLTAKCNTQRLLKALQDGDLATFIDVAESEAIQLHELMATSTPSIRLVERNTLKIIDEITIFRQKSGVPVCFTLDAGPNVHMLYPNEFKDKIGAFIEDKLAQYCFENRFIDDFVKLS